MMELNKFYNIDCMEYMKTVPDKFFELAIVDPPYGLGGKVSRGGGSHTKRKCKFVNLYKENNKNWDIVPDKLYFSELFRISKNQIIWGGNYFNLPPCRGFIIWDKDRAVENFSQIEFAWSSSDRHAKLFKYCNNAGFILKPIDYRIHPTQKPVALYRWLLQNYAKPGDKIFDSHVGSASSIIACLEEKFEYVGCELDKDYYRDACKRIEIHKEQLRLF